MPRRLHCTLLLELEDRDLERRFWQDDDTLRTYTNYDTYISSHLLAMNLLFSVALLKVLTDPSVLAHTWHLHATILINVVSCAANLAVITRHPVLYKRHRHSIIMGQRLLRLVCMLLSAYKSSDGLQAAFARGLNVEPAEGPAAAHKLRAAVLNLTRPLFLAPVLTAAHAGWLFRTKLWLPVQLLTFLLAVFGSARHQSCRMAADASSALLLQPTCKAVGDIHKLVVGAVLGSLSLLSNERPAACSSMEMSARTLGWYAQAIYGIFMPAAAFCTMEWRLKARWVKETQGKQLVYGPLCWPQRRPQHSTPMNPLAASLRSFAVWVLATMLCWVLLWEVVTWAVPQLPLAECRTCEEAGTCEPIPCVGGACRWPSYLAACVFYAQAVVVLMGHLASTCLRR